MRYYYFFWFTVLLSFSTRGLAYNLPSYYRSSKLSTHVSVDELDQIILELNGRRLAVKNNGIVSFIRGDVIKIVAVAMKPATPFSQTSLGVATTDTSHFGEVNVVGFLGGNKGNLRNDLGYEIDTEKYLTGRDWALDEMGTVYGVVTASSPDIVHGVVFLKRIEPVLKWVELIVNGKTHIVRQGQELELKERDRFKVVDIVSNLESSTRSVDLNVNVLPIGNKSDESHSRYEIQISRKSLVFGNIPVVIEKG